MMKEIRFKALSEDAFIPEKATVDSIAFDLRIPRTVSVPVGRSIIPLDFAMALPKGYEMKIEPRSGFSAKGVLGTSKDAKEEQRFDADVIVGKVDSDYRGCVGIIINNHDGEFWLKRGTRLAQATIYYSDPMWHFVTVTDLDDTKRGIGGFGHTGAY